MGMGPHGESVLARTGKKSILDMTAEEVMFMVLLDQAERTEKRQRARVRFFSSKPKVVKQVAKVEYVYTKGKEHYWKWESGEVTDTGWVRHAGYKVPRLPKVKDRRVVK